MKKIIAATAAGLLALTLAACSSGGSPSSSTPGAPGPEALSSVQGVTKITFWHPLGGTNGEALEALVDQFNSANKGKIEVSSSFQGAYADILAKYSASLRDNSSPTVLLAGDIAAGYLKDVQRSESPEAMAAANPADLKLAELRKAATNYYSSDGKMFAVPFNSSVPVLWVNEDIAKAAGVDPATDLSTLADVAVAAKKITATTGKAGLVEPFDDWWFEQATAASGNVLCTPGNGRGADGQATSISLTESKQKAAFKVLADLYTSGVGLDVGVDGNAAVTAFTGGKVGLMFNSSGSAGGIAAAKTPFNYTAVPYPLSGDKSDSGTVVGGAGLYLSSTATDAEKVAGWKFESFLTSATSQETFTHATGYVPVNTGVDTSATQATWITEHPFAQVFVDQANTIPAVPATAGCLSGAMSAIRAAIVPQMQSAFSGTTTLDKALTAAETDANKAIDQYLEQLG